jgi:hypothetical protein
MARFAWVVLALALVLPLSACGSGGGGGGFSGLLEICNDDATFDTIVAVDVEDLDSGFVFEYTFDILPGECADIDEFFPGFYDVTVYWDFGPSPITYGDVFIEDDEITTIFADNGD